MEVRGEDVRIRMVFEIGRVEVYGDGEVCECELECEGEGKDGMVVWRVRENDSRIVSSLVYVVSMIVGGKDGNETMEFALTKSGQMKK
jgi:hypothetical protein